MFPNNQDVWLTFTLEGSRVQTFPANHQVTVQIVQIIIGFPINDVHEKNVLVFGCYVW